MKPTKSQLLDSILGKPKRGITSAKGEREYNCPFCDGGRRKYKLGVNLTINAAHCWLCEWKGSVYKLFKVLDVADELIKEYYDWSGYVVSDILPEHDVALPDGYLPLFSLQEDGFIRTKVMKYLAKRHLDMDDIKRYRIGWDTDEFRIVVPSYDFKGDLNYYVARSFLVDVDDRFKYKNPHISKNEVIFNELFVDWNTTVVLVEGVFDHLVTPNSIPLLGKEVHDLLIKKLLENGSRVILMFDGDSEGQLASKKAYRKLTRYGILPKLVELTNNDDPSKLGRDEVRKRLLLASKPLFRDTLFPKK